MFSFLHVPINANKEPKIEIMRIKMIIIQYLLHHWDQSQQAVRINRLACLVLFMVQLEYFMIIIHMKTWEPKLRAWICVYMFLWNASTLLLYTHVSSDLHCYAWSYEIVSVNFRRFASALHTSEVLLFLSEYPTQSASEHHQDNKTRRMARSP